MFLCKQIDQFKIVPSMGVSRPGWIWLGAALFAAPAALMGGLLLRKYNSFLEYSFLEEIPSWCSPSGAHTRLSHPKCCCHEEYPSFLKFQTYWFPYPASFPQLRTELLAVNLEQSCCCSQNQAETIYEETKTQGRFIAIPEHTQVIS